MNSQATTIGRAHRLMQQNCQDAAFAGMARPEYNYGLVLDGCGSKQLTLDESGRRYLPSRNEVSARLLGRFAAAWLEVHLTASLAIPLLLEQLHIACLGFLTALTSLFPLRTGRERQDFIATHLLCTLAGFVVTPEAAAFFWSGDGYLCHNGQVTRLESNNRPDYLAYQLLDQSPRSWQTRQITNRANIAWLAVASDGWQPELLAELAQPRSSLELQRWLNVQARERCRFEDDGAVAIWYGNQSSGIEEFRES